MNLDEYQALALRTTNTSLTPLMRWANVGMGIAGECGEVEECQYDLKKELGDTWWYLADGCSAAGISLEELHRESRHWIEERYSYPNIAPWGCAVCDLLKKVAFHGHEFELAKFVKLASRVLRGTLTIMEDNAFELEDILHQNVAKLRNRYPDRFSEERSRERTE